MDFLKILKSFEEFLYEAVTWLVFFPRTLWRVTLHPQRMARYADDELGDPLRSQFTDALSPPLFLLLAVLLAHALEIATHAAMPATANELSRAVFGSQQNLLIYRAITFGIWPLIATVYLLHRTRTPLDRETMRRPFYVQCYLAAPFAIALSSGAVFVRMKDPATQLVGLAVMALACLWYVCVQAHWFRLGLQLPWWRAIGATVLVLVLGLVINTLIAVVLLAPG